MSDPTDRPAAATGPAEPLPADPRPAPPPALRSTGSGRRVLVLGGAAVVVVVVVAVVAWRALAADDAPRPSGPEAADQLMADYARTLDSTFLVEGELTRTVADGRTLTSAYLTVQRPPDHLQRQLGSTTGTIGGRSVNCSTPAGGSYQCGATGAAVSWAEERQGILDALDSYVRGDDPVYSTEVDEDGCYVLVRRRTELDATYGQRARLCFDERFGSIRRLEVQRDGGATDVLLAVRTTDEVTDADFDLQADDTYDPVVPDEVGDVPPTSS